MGSSMVSTGGRLYFLGGEGRWQLTWYQVEDDKWGVDVGLTPARLLAAVAVVGERIFLIGGVTVEEFPETANTLIFSLLADGDRNVLSVSLSFVLYSGNWNVDRPTIFFLLWLLRWAFLVFLVKFDDWNVDRATILCLGALAGINLLL